MMQTCWTGYFELNKISHMQKKLEKKILFAIALIYIQGPPYKRAKVYGEHSTHACTN